MNNPLAASFGDFKIRSQKNKEEDEKSILDRRTEKLITGGNPCPFPTKVFVINMSSRPDRWEGFESRNSELFREFEVQRWEATITTTTSPNVVDAIFGSFMRCMEETFGKEEVIIMMEDDAYLAEGGLEKLRLAWEDLPGDWDVLVGNHYFFGQIEVLTDHLAKPVVRASTANFGVFRKTCLQKIKDHQGLRDSYPTIRDFDHYVTSDMVPVNNYTVWPMISREIASFSDHRQRHLDAATRIRENAFKYKFIDGDKYYSSLEGW